MLERIAEALEMDSPELFSTQVFTDEAIKIVQDKVQADLDEVSISIKQKITEIKIIKNWDCPFFLVFSLQNGYIV